MTQRAMNDPDEHFLTGHERLVKQMRKEFPNKACECDRLGRSLDDECIYDDPCSECEVNQ